MRKAATALHFVREGESFALRICHSLIELRQALLNVDELHTQSDETDGHGLAASFKPRNNQGGRSGGRGVRNGGRGGDNETRGS